MFDGTVCICAGEDRRRWHEVSRRCFSLFHSLFLCMYACIYVCILLYMYTRCYIHFIAPLFAYNFGFAFIAHTISFIIISLILSLKLFCISYYSVVQVFQPFSPLPLCFDLMFEKCEANKKLMHSVQISYMLTSYIYLHTCINIHTLCSGRLNSFDKSKKERANER